MTDLSGASISWRGLTIAGTHASRHWFSLIDGWEGVPDVRRDSDARPGAHGRFSGPAWSDERVITVTGGASIPAERDTLLREVQAAMVVAGDGGEEDLTITLAGRELTVGATLTRFRPDLSRWSSGRFSWAAEWRCPDPLRYGAYVTAPASFPTLVGGLEYDLYTDGAGADLGYLDYGEASSTGRATLTNEGTAATWPQFEVAGPIDASGFEIVTVGTGARLVFEGAVPAGSVLVLDSATGAVLMDGESDRSDLLTWRDWWSVPAGGSVEFAFIRLGSDVGGTPSVTAALRPAFW